ncbi:MAG TPA: hypothetical protein PLW68_13265 [Casimicrobiaceae bacterium]|nr:hypothetical protein [Casimicrobiaceae bacterium]
MKHAAYTFSTYAPDLRVRGIGSMAFARCAAEILGNAELMVPVPTGGKGNFATL